LRSWPQVDDQLAVERLGDSEQGVDARRATTGLEPRDRGLRRPGQFGQLLLREPARLALFDDLLRDAREEPPLVGIDMRKPLAEAFESISLDIPTLL
jgi:hypothetical protein